MKNLTLSFLLLALLSCNDDEDSVKQEEPFHITLGFPEELARVANVISLGKLSVLITDIPLQKSVGVVCIDEFAQVKWSKTFSCPTENGLSLTEAGKVDDQTFFLSGQLENGNPFVAEINLAGEIKNAHKLSSNKLLHLERVYYTNAGNRLWTGYHYENEYISVAVKENKATGIIWARAFPDHQFMVSALPDESENNTFLFPAFGDGANAQTILKINNEGSIVQTTEIRQDSELLFQKAVTIDGNYYLIFSEWHGTAVRLVKVNSAGEYMKGIMFTSAEYPTLTVQGSTLFAALADESAMKLLEIDPELNVTNKTTGANLVGAGSFDVEAEIGVTADAISCVLLPTNNDPTYGSKALNIIRILRKAWKPKCEIAEKNVSFFPSSFQNAIGNASSPAAIDIQKSSITIQASDITLQKQVICK